MSSIHNLMQQITATAAAAGTVKSASDNVPTEGHPTDSFQDRATLPKGPEIEESGAEQKDQFGAMAGASKGKVNPEEDEPTTIGTELNHGGDQADPALKPSAGADDPGPETDHPASPNNTPTKYASMTNLVELADELQACSLRITAKLAADPSLMAAPLPQKPAAKTAATPAAPAESPTNARIAALQGLLATQELAHNASVKVAELYTPYVTEGIRRANQVYKYLSAVSTDPKLAADMMGLPPEAAGDPAAGGDPGMGGDPAMMAGGDPAAAPAGDPGMGGDPAGGGDPGAGGGEGEMLDQLVQLIEQVAQEEGIDPMQLAQEVTQMLQGGGDPGAGAAGGDMGGMPPEAAGPEGAPPEADPAAGGATPEAEPKMAAARTAKTAAAPTAVKRAGASNVRAAAMQVVTEMFRNQNRQ